MKIRIHYNSCWRNSFLDGSNSEPAKNKKGRKFIASITELNKPKTNNYIEREITQDTTIGVLCRLIGDQRKLYQSRIASDYYFKDLEQDITFEDIDTKRIVSNEVVYLRNLTKSTDQNSFTGMIKTNHHIFKSDYSQQFWGVLDLSFDRLCDFIIDDAQVTTTIDLDPLTIKTKFENLKKSKAVKNESKAKRATEKLQDKFIDFKPCDNKGNLKVLQIYCSALYLQLERLANNFDMTTAKSKAGKISGISKNSFTAKDFMACYITGKKKPVYGNPYIKTEFIKEQGKVNKVLQKASGVLEIKLNISKDKAQELKQLIENAGVSAFPLGKKGLAYVSKIRI